MSRAENEGEQEREFCRVEKKTLLPLFVFSSLLFPCSSSSPPLSQEKSLTLRSGAGDHQGDRDRGEEEAGRGHCCWLEAVERRKKRERVLKGFLSVEFFFSLLRARLPCPSLVENSIGCNDCAWSDRLRGFFRLDSAKGASESVSQTHRLRNKGR